MTKTKHLLAPGSALLLGLASVSPVGAFTIDFLSTYVAFENISHVGQPVHEEITRDALTNVTPAISLALLVNLQRGVQNADITHQFDSESHFDNCSVFLNVGFSNGFATMSQRVESARQGALNNPEFMAPHYTSFLDIRLMRLRNAIRAYSAHQDLGHALHAAQDFFAHSDYVELMAGVGVGQGIPPGTAIPLPADFSQFNLPGLQSFMGPARFNLLESGEVLTIWLGDGDFSLGDAGVQNFFNPNTGIEIGGIDLLGLTIPAVAISSVGQNANPFPGFSHGHYLSSTALGLNKDNPPSSPGDEPAHQNHFPARQAAVRMSALMWSAFLQSVGEVPTPVLLTCAPDKVVSTDPGRCSATGVDLGLPSASGGCQSPAVTDNAPLQFVKGTNVVRWTATGSCGNSATCNQMIVVVDGEVPQMVCSTNRVLAATSSSGATAIFPTPLATDNCPGVSASCNPTSGSTLPIGTTTIGCTAVDTSGHRQTCTFTVRVKGAAEQIRDLTTLVSSFRLPNGTENSLATKLKSALAALLAGNEAAACVSLQSFIDHANAQSGKKRTAPQARLVVAAAKQITTVIKSASAWVSKRIK